MELNIKGDLTVEEIHKIREYNYYMTKDMTPEESRAYTQKGVDEFMEKMRLFREQRASV